MVRQIVLSVVFGLLGIGACNAQGPSLSKAVETWQNAANQVKSFKCQLKGRMTRPDGETTRTDEFVESLIVEGYDGKSMRHETDYPVRVVDTGKFEKQRRTIASNKSDQQMLTEYLRSQRPIGNITAPDTTVVLQQAHLWPLMIALRGLIPAMGGFERSLLSETERMGEINGESVRIVTESEPGEPPHRELWIDSKGLVRRCDSINKGRISCQIDIDYKTQDGTYYPWKWKSMLNRPTVGDITETEIEVSSIEFNPKLGPDDFRLTFPPATMVFEERSKRQFVAGQDGSLQELSKAEAKAMWSSAAGEIFPSRNREPSRSRFSLVTFLLLGGVIAIAAGAALAWRRRKLN